MTTQLPLSGVYCIRDQYTKRTYVGSSKDLEKRLREHKNKLRRGRHHSTFLQRAWNKYGEQAFEFFVMEYAPYEEVRDREQWWLSNTTCAYNLSRSASGGCERIGAAGAEKALRSRRAKATRYEVRGEMLSLREISERYGISLNTLNARLRYGHRGDQLVLPNHRGSRQRIRESQSRV